MSNRSKKIKRAKLISGTVLMVLFLLLWLLPTLLIAGLVRHF